MFLSHLAFRSLIITLTALVSIPTFAQPNPGTPSMVYRVDTRPPAEVFANGFSTGGGLLSLLAHVFGSACGDASPAHRSAWVSTTANREQTLQFAYQQLNDVRIPQQALNGGSGIWIYSIAPDNTFLHVPSIFSRVISVSNSAQYGFTPLHAEMLSRLVLNYPNISQEAEVVALRVRPEQIYAGALVTLNPNNEPGRPLDLSRPAITNPNYQQPASTITNQVNNLDVLVPPQSISLYGSITNQTCYLGCDGAASHRQQRSGSSPALSCAAKPNNIQRFMGADE